MAVLDRAHSIGNLSLGLGIGTICQIVWAHSIASGKKLFEMHITIGELLLKSNLPSCSCLGTKKPRAALTLTPREYGE